MVVGHLVGGVAGYLALVLTGLTNAPPVTEAGLTPGRVLSAGLSLAVTALVLQAINAPHPPAGATTLIVSLGLLTQLPELATIMISGVFVTAAATALNLLAGVRQAGVRSRTEPSRNRSPE